MKISPKLSSIPTRLISFPTGMLLAWVGRLPLVLVLAWLLFTRLGPHRPEIPQAIRQSVDQQIAAAMDDLAAKATAAHTGRIAVLYLDRDDSEYATTEIRRQLLDRGIALQPDQTAGEKVRELIGLSQQTTSSLDQAIAEGRSRNLDAVIFGTLNVKGTDAKLELHFADMHTGVGSSVIIPTVPATLTLLSSMSPAIHPDGEYHILRSWVVWAIVAMLLPIFTVGFLREVVRKESNRRNFFALAVYTTVDALLLWLMLESTNLFWQIGSVLVGATAIFFYNVSVMTWALKMDAGSREVRR
jgi:hypothetical protein